MRSAPDLALLRAFASELKAQRAVLALSQEGLAHAAGLNRTFVAKLETGTTSASLTSLVRLATALQVDPAEMMKGLMMRYRRESGGALQE